MNKVIKQILAGIRLMVYPQLRSLLAAAELHHTERVNAALCIHMKHFGKGSAIWGKVFISSPEMVEIGDNVHLGGGAFIKSEGGLTIGDNTHISRNVVIYTANHQYDGKRLPYDEELVAKPVRIGRNVWVGMNVCVAPGTEIGDGAIVGMGCTVSGFVPPLAIIGSSKWRVLGTRDAEHYRLLDTSFEYGGPNGTPYHPMENPECRS